MEPADFGEICAFRHRVHRHPELAGYERQTASLIRAELAKMPEIRILPPFLGTDTVAFIDGNGAGPNVTLRADIDALPVTEETGAEFASEVPGVMHACGHDVHQAMLLGAARELYRRRREFSGSVRLVFQPGEETLALGRDLVAAGALENPAPDFVAAMHISPAFPVGTFASKAGPVLAACQHFSIVFHGQGGHGSTPHTVHNPVVAACDAVCRLQNIPNLLINAQRSVVVSICLVNGGQCENVVPDTCKIGGTIRALDDDSMVTAAAALQKIAEATAEMHQCRAAVNLPRSYAAAVNSPEAVALARETVAGIGCRFEEMADAFMFSEDFSFYLKRCPRGVMTLIGVGTEQPPLHNCRLLPPDEVIRVGADYFAELALRILSK